MPLKPLPALLLLVLLLAAPAAWAQSGPACWNRTMELIDNTVSPPEGGDQAFFTRVGGGPPLGFMIFANSPGMFSLPGFEPSQVPANERGCAKSTYLNSRLWRAPNPLYQYSTTTSSATSCITSIPTPAQDGRAYDKNFVYPRIDDACYLNSSYKTLDDIVPNRFYVYRSWGDTGFGTGRDLTSACSTMPAVEQGACQLCLAGGEPYYISPTITAAKPNDAVFRGNFLHFFGPSYIGALNAWKTTISSNAKIIWGHGYYDNGNQPGIAKGKDPNPACNKFDTDFNAANRGSYINSFSNTPPNFGGITKFPLAQALFSVGYFLTDVGRFSSASTYVRTNAWAPTIGGNQDTICSPCQYSAAVVITDGQVNNDTVIHPTIQALAVDTPGDKTKLGAACSVPSDCGTSLQCVSGTCQDQWWADDVAAYFQRTDVRRTVCGITATNPAPGLSCDPEKQIMTTYVINVGTPGNPALQNVARVGGGLYLEASSAADIRDALNRIVNDIIRRSTAYSVASVTSVQTRTTTAVFVPRFKPSVLTQWEGHLYRYKLFNENAAGCTKGVDTVAPFDAAKLAKNPNGDSSCGDVYLVDADGRFIGENDSGDFVRLDTSQPYPWPPTETPARPLWDSAEKVVQAGPAARTILAAVDVNGNGSLDQGEQIPFDVSNVDRLLPALGLGGYTGDFCTNLASRLSTTFLTDADCARVVIRFVRGEDVFDEDGDGNRAESRSLVLGDIFHSSPQLVVPPLTPFLCDLGVNKVQCAASIFHTPTPGADSYSTFQAAKSGRKQFVLVGANDGMLHAFDAGSQRTGDDPDTALVEPANNKYFDAGTGSELWAFIPPEMLPKLKRLLTSEGHKEYVDGSPMVRDVWVDLDRNGRKSADEFRTVAVVGMRRGGRSWLALDVTDPASPNFLWSNPPPGSADALVAGQSWNDFAPRPPPIVPVVVKAASPYPTSFTSQGVGSREQWVVFLNGGYDPAGVRGRSIHAYDVWSGQRVFRYAFRDSSGSSDPRSQLGSVAAVPGVVDWGNDVTGYGIADWLFDTANVGDMNGNLWTVRFGAPAEDTNGDGLYDNWFVGRALDSAKGSTLGERLPFFEMPVQVGLFDPSGKARLRAYVGTGDRAQVRDRQGGVCSLNNLAACLRKGCSIDVNESKQHLGGAQSSMRWAASGSGSSPTTNSLSAQGDTAACDVRAEASVTTTINCGTGGSGTFTYGLDCSNGQLPCATLAQRPLGVAFPFDGSSRLNRFYSVSIFDGISGPARVPFNTASGATTYDNARLGDGDLANPTAATPTFANYDSAGFVIPYEAQDERTTGAALAGGAGVFWNTLVPLTTYSSCSRSGSDTGKFYQAHIVTGGSALDTGTNRNVGGTVVARSTSQTVLTPPKTPIVQKVLTPAGEVVTVGLSIEPGLQPAAVETGRYDLYSPIQVLEVDRKTHDCRHASPAKCD